MRIEISKKDVLAWLEKFDDEDVLSISFGEKNAVERISYRLKAYIYPNPDVEDPLGLRSVYEVRTENGGYLVSGADIEEIRIIVADKGYELLNTDELSVKEFNRIFQRGY